MNERLHVSDRDSRRGRRGVILLITLVILVILSTLGYTLCVQVAARRHRDQYVINYCIARHACASGLKYALATVGGLQFDLVSRPNEPDFSDVFAMSEPQYQKLLDQVAAQLAADPNFLGEGFGAVGLSEQTKLKDAEKMAGQTTGLRDTNDINDVNDLLPGGGALVDRKLLRIRGPYGPPWPLVTEPMEFEVGSAKVKIEIEDENAKYPLGWVMIADDKLKPLLGASWSTFCEWMGYTPLEISRLNEGLARIEATKPFKTEFKLEAEPAATPPANARITRPPPGTPVRRTVPRKPITVEEQIDRQDQEYARLLHSSLIDRDLLSRPSIASDTRQESAMKYLGLWATRHVNVNTAPRQVLEAALSLGSVANAPKIAEQIIQQRRIQAIADVNELKQAVPRYAGAIDNCRNFITARSTVLTIRVTAFSGVARVTAVAAVRRQGDKVQPIAALSE
jgi:hypothetical protein